MVILFRKTGMDEYFFLLLFIDVFVLGEPLAYTFSIKILVKITDLELKM